MTFTIVAAVGYPGKRRPAQSAFEFIGSLPGALFSKAEQWTKTSEPLKQYRNPIHLAREWRKALDSGEVSSQSELAQNLGVSRARVSQVLRLLQLSPEVVNAIADLGDSLPGRIVTERSLRPMANLPAEEQESRMYTILMNLAEGEASGVLFSDVLRICGKLAADASF